MVLQDFDESAVTKPQALTSLVFGAGFPFGIQRRHGQSGLIVNTCQQRFSAYLGEFGLCRSYGRRFLFLLEVRLVLILIKDKMIDTGVVSFQLVAGEFFRIKRAGHLCFHLHISGGARGKGGDRSVIADLGIDFHGILSRLFFAMHR